MEGQVLTLPRKMYNVTIIMAGIIIAVFLDLLLYILIARKGMGQVERWYISRLVCWLILPFLYLYSAKVEGRDLVLWKEKPYRTYFYIAAVAVLLLTTDGMIWISRIPHYLKFHDDYKEMIYVDSLMKRSKMLLVVTCITAGVTEELTIRGYVLPRLSLLFKSDYMPVIISALLFASIHIGYHNLSELIFTFLFGIVSGVFYNKYRNIKILMIFHFLYDLAINL
jgi:membrane protease YdiL (CAAX protease family)